MSNTLEPSTAPLQTSAAVGDVQQLPAGDDLETDSDDGPSTEELQRQLQKKLAREAKKKRKANSITKAEVSLIDAQDR
jgi:hypothetical protein